MNAPISADLICKLHQRRRKHSFHGSRCSIYCLHFRHIMDEGFHTHTHTHTHKHLQVHQTTIAPPAFIWLHLSIWLLMCEHRGRKQTADYKSADCTFSSKWLIRRVILSGLLDHRGGGEWRRPSMEPMPHLFSQWADCFFDNPSRFHSITSGNNHCSALLKGLSSPTIIFCHLSYS